MTFRARKVFGTFEKRAPDQNCIAYARSNSSKKAICTPILQRLVHCCCCVQLHEVLRKKNRICFIVNPFTYKPAVVISLSSLFLLSRFMELLASIRW